MNVSVPPRTASVLCAMLGPGPSAQGGVASVVKVYADAGLMSSGPVLFLETFSPAGSWTKLLIALSAFSAYLLLLLRGQAQVLHVHVSSRGSFWRKAVFIWLARLARRRVVFHLHGGGFRQFVEELSPLPAWLARATLRCSSRFLCLSTPVGIWLQEIAPGIPVQWWPNPVPADLFEIEPDPLQADIHVLYLGALLPAKGVDDLLRAFAILHQQRPQARLVLGGAGPEGQALQRLAADLGLSSAAHFVGWVGPEAKRDCLAKSRMLVLPSHLEAQPMVLLEAMAAGVPVLSTAVGGVPDLVTDGVHGLLVPSRAPAALGDAMLRLWDDATLRNRLAEQARRRVAERHRAARVCEALLTMYSNLAAERA
jgi:glycosyltransferase involved in cell wall biosynthesis